MREQLRLEKEAGEPEEADLGIGEVSMHEANQVQSNLEEMTQQMMPVVQACYEEQAIIEDEFLAVCQDQEILEGRIRTEKAKIEGEVSRVGGQVGLQQAISEEMRTGITILQTQDNIIVQGASSIFQAIYKQIADMISKQTCNGSTLLNH